MCLNNWNGLPSPASPAIFDFCLVRGKTGLILGRGVITFGGGGQWAGILRALTSQLAMLVNFRSWSAQELDWNQRQPAAIRRKCLWCLLTQCSQQKITDCTSMPWFQVLRRFCVELYVCYVCSCFVGAENNTSVPLGRNAPEKIHLDASGPFAPRRPARGQRKEPSKPIPPV